MTTKRAPTYRELVAKHNPKPIRNERDHEKALRLIDGFMSPRPPRGVAEFIELLAILIGDYESQMFGEPNVSPVEMLQHLLDARQITRADLSRATGIHQSALSEILAGKRPVSKGNALKLADYFALGVDHFIASGM